MTWMIVWLGGSMGIVLGLLGGGGSIIAVPVFVYIVGFETKVAIALSLGIVGAVSLVGAVGHWREGNVNVRVAALFGGVAMAGTYGGARLATLVSGSVQLLLFGFVMLAAAYAMLRGPKEPSSTRHRRINVPLIAVEGSLVGILTGLVGVGGGFLVVPALVVLGGMPMKHAVGTSLLVITLKSAAGFIGYLGQVDIPWRFMLMFSTVAAGGMLVGIRLTRSLPHRVLQRAFAALLLVVGTTMLYVNRGTLGLTTPPEQTHTPTDNTLSVVPSGDRSP